MSCSIPYILAFSMATYLIASILYLIITFGSQSRPFYKSLTRRQRLVLAKSKKKRRNIFILSCVLACASLWYFKPFSSCKCRLTGGYPTTINGGYPSNTAQPVGGIGTHPLTGGQTIGYPKMVTFTQ